MTNSIKEIGDAELIFVIGSNTTEAHPVISYYIKRAVRKGAKLIVNDPRKIDLTRWADLYVKLKPGTDVAYFNGLIREIIANDWHDKDYIKQNTEGFEELKAIVEPYTLEKTEEITGVKPETLKKVARMLGEAKVSTLLYTLGLTEHISGTDNVKSTANLQMVLGNVGKYAGGVNPLRGQNNVQGACDMGALPNVYHCYQAVTDIIAKDKFEKAWGTRLDDKVGLMMPSMFKGALDGSVKALYIYGENVVMTEPNMKHTQHCLEECEFVISGEIFENETTPFADVIFPDLAWCEEEGTYTNSERRVQRVRKALTPPGDARSNWWVLNELGKRLGYDMGFESAHDIWNELQELGPSYHGITWERIEKQGLQWPCPTEDHQGTLYLHKDGNFARGKGKFNAIEYRPPAEKPDKEFPFWLSTGRRLWHYNSVQTHYCDGMHDICGEEWLELSPKDSEKMDIKTGDTVRVKSRRGEIELMAWVTDRSPEGVLWCSFHFAKACGNVLTNDVFDPVTETAEYKISAVSLEKIADGDRQKYIKLAERQARP